MVILTLGTFDLFHKGHVRLLKACSKIGGGIENRAHVIVGLNSDKFVKKYRGKLPIMNYEERESIIDNFRGVYEIYKNDSAGKELIKRLKPDFLVVGNDWARKDYYKQIDMTQKELDDLGITLIFVPYTEGISSTEIKRRIRE